MDWRKMSAAELGRGIGAGQIDPMELCAAFLDAIASHDHGDRIYARTTPHRALAEAAAARDRARAGRRLGPLDGVPVSWKDLFDTAGVATEAGSALLAGRVPGRDAAVLDTVTAQGLVCLGKTHMTELAFSGLGVNPMTATPPCIHDPQAAPGGSSSGAAASVAFGLAAAGIGSDTGGSVRVPAVWNDLVGLKTTAGRLPLAGVVPLAPKFDTVGPLTRTVEDAALLLAALEGGRPADLRGATLNGARLMVLETVALDGLREAPRAGFEHALTRLAAAGATLEWRAAPEVADAMALSGVLFATEAYGTWENVIEAAPERMYPEILKRFRGGRDHAGTDYVAAWQRLDRLRADWVRRIAGFDAVVLPTCPILPPNVARLLADPDFFVSENLLALRNTRIGNLMGATVLTIPTGIASTGISLMGAPMSEARLLRLGAAAEVALA
ncbi:aspartyl-tRNA(Asn)/glutamyl-tRNA(Gln) amidotransferase subunit A [Rhodovulum bhavnagarense]|uniref:Aspartyl-tRNA(Asn)/glutamyl-tRNA(Gln) amidotransferase subunit A n=1 Tax=Rhodovulum bhavnagarense TaxID=992286 RepID=A0A4R2RDP9_9RHOB|nr:amidase family protein [Rhodovulum bhavnagarense]TCP61600.1 aspartyl-tRNA(Asn)/glutamyl-tRNA(Gln) amidotransferase subunit A [Rhodovulum bhavnagarense]